MVENVDGAGVLRVALAGRYLTAFRNLERILRERARAAGLLINADDREREVYELLNVAQAQRWVMGDAAAFLHACRRARNAFAHVGFDGYSGPAALPPEQVVFRLERITASLTNPPKAKTVCQNAITCNPESRIGTVLALMHERDLSQIPYRLSDGSWELVTHQTISRWASAEAGTGSECLLDLSMSVSDVVDASGMRCRPVVRQGDALVAELIAHLEEAVDLPDDAVGGYATVLVESNGNETVRIFTPEDLPAAYELIGR